MSGSLIDGLKPLVKRFPGAAHAYRVWRDGRFDGVEPQPTPYGFRLTGHEAMMAGTFEPGETALVKALLAGADLFVNVGANVGYYVCHAIQAGVPAIAIEPLRRNLEYLLRNIRANDGADKVIVLPVAVAAHTGILELYGAGTGASLVKGWAGAPADVSQLTPVIALDMLRAQVAAARSPLILIDVEGAEAQALAGASGLLALDNDIRWIVEISFGEHAGAPNPLLADTFGHFRDAGYRVWTATGTPEPIPTAALAAAIEAGTNPFGTGNFLFSRTDPDPKPRTKA